MLGSSDDPLSQVYDLAMLDLDGVVYIGGEAVPGAPGHLDRARSAGLRLAYITNNASRPPATVAAHLRELGVEAADEDVVTSSQAAARLLADRYGAGAEVVLLGAEGLADALRERGLRPVGIEDDAAAVVTGYGPDVLWRDIMRVAVRIRHGLPWVATNTDMTFPAAYGVAPGHGVLVQTLQSFSGVEPTVAGKPERPLLDETVRRVGGTRPLMVGDRLDTDIEGAHRAGYDSLLVLTGVTGLEELVTAPEQLRPTYVSPDLAGLLEPQPTPEADGREQVLGGWRAAVRDGRLEVSGAGEAADWWRVVATAAWQHLDDQGEPADHGALEPPR